MTAAAAWVANGASLEDCHSNHFSLVSSWAAGWEAACVWGRGVPDLRRRPAFSSCPGTSPLPRLSPPFA